MSIVRRFRAVPWILVFVALRILWEHWQRVEERDRARVTGILKDSHGDPRKMSQKDRRDVVDIAKRFDAVALGRDLTAAAVPFPTPGLRSKPPKKS